MGDFYAYEDIYNSASGIMCDNTTLQSKPEEKQESKIKKLVTAWLNDYDNAGERITTKDKQIHYCYEAMETVESNARHWAKNNPLTNAAIQAATREAKKAKEADEAEKAKEADEAKKAKEADEAEIRKSRVTCQNMREKKLECDIKANKERHKQNARHQRRMHRSIEKKAKATRRAQQRKATHAKTIQQLQVDDKKLQNAHRDVMRRLAQQKAGFRDVPSSPPYSPSVLSGIIDVPSSPPYSPSVLPVHASQSPVPSLI